MFSFCGRPCREIVCFAGQISAEKLVVEIKVVLLGEWFDENVPMQKSFIPSKSSLKI